MPTPREWGTFGLHAGIALAPAVLLFLWTCDFFSAWDGRAVSVRPGSPEALTRTVLIAGPAGAIERQWPSALVEKLALPVDAVAVPPDPIPPERPVTWKRRWRLGFEVLQGETRHSVPTTSPRALGLALLAWAGLVALRNMAVGGTPWAVAPRERYAVPVADRAGQVVTKRYKVSKPGPPPPRPVKGRGRRA